MPFDVEAHAVSVGGEHSHYEIALAELGYSRGAKHSQRDPAIMLDGAHDVCDYAADFISFCITDARRLGASSIPENLIHVLAPIGARKRRQKRFTELQNEIWRSW